MSLGDFFGWILWTKTTCYWFLKVKKRITIIHKNRK